MVDQHFLPSAIRAMQHYLQADEGLGYEELKAQLSSAVIYMMLHEMEKLMSLLYRIDVNEKKVKQAFAQNDPKLIAPALAELILQRELQKAESRAKFNSGNKEV
jgi:hypothetical protein